MKPRRSLIAAAFVSLFAPRGTRAQADLGTQAVDALEALFGVHPGARRAHAKGRLYDGRFTPAPRSAALSRAPQFAMATPLVIRYSDGAGVPNIPDGDPDAVPVGMALRFLTPDGRPNDIVTNADEGFPVRNGEDFVAFVRAAAESRTGAASPTPIERFVAAHPETQRFFARPHPTAASFASTRYFGNNALVFVAASGTRRAFRYVIEPAAGTAILSPDEARRQPPDFLFDELGQRLQRGPVTFTLVAQMAAAGDPTNDVTILWPVERERITLGTIAVTGLHANQAEERQLFYDPTNLPDGVEVSDDPLLPLRAQSYGVSIARRTTN
jgi:catalase